MFGKLKNIFKRAEQEVEEKIEEKAEEEGVLEEVEEVEEVEESGEELPVDEEVGRHVSDEKEIKVEEPIQIQEAIEEGVKEERTAPKTEKAPKKEEKRRDSKLDKKINIGFRSKIKKTLGAKVRLSESEIEDIIWNLQMALMQSDVALEVSEAICNELKERLAQTDFKDPRGQIREIFRSTLVDLLEEGGSLDFFEEIKRSEKPVRVVFFGINGSGKTTTIAKLASMLKEQGHSVVVAAGDTFRAGAQEQLAKHAETIGIKMIHHQRGGDPAAVIYDAIAHAKANNIDVVLADTSGRMQSDVDLMGEMEKIIRVNKPDIKIFVGDALTGNDAIEQARIFNDRIGIDCAILTKFDASKGGAALSVAHITKRPILFLGVGQKYSDLQKFDAGEFVDEILE